jgi:uncharacterized membrane protein
VTGVVGSALLPSPADSPSAWSHRLPVAVLALFGCAIAAYLSLYQWHVRSSVWDPLFGSPSSEAVLTSALSRALPVPDSALGALAYAVEFVFTMVGGSQRWRERPTLVLLFGVVLVGLAATSLVLVLSQVLLVHALCSLCLSSAAISFVNLYLGRGEVLTTVRRRLDKENKHEELAPS